MAHGDALVPAPRLDPSIKSWLDLPYPFRSNSASNPDNLLSENKLHCNNRENHRERAITAPEGFHANWCVLFSTLTPIRQCGAHT